MIEVRHLQKQFGAVTAVRDVSFHAPDSAITGLLGANGAGKSTTLRIICGVLKPSAGEVVAGGRPGALLDHVGLYTRLTPREILTYSGRLHGIPSQLLHERIEELMDVLGMRSIADRPTGGFSQGERMKTALARAIVHAPRDLLLDEPTSGLDIPSVRSLRAFLQKLRNDGTCILLSSHVLEEVQALCDRIVILAGGRVVAQGTSDDLCRQAGAPNLEEAFVALIGSEEVSAC